MIPITLFGAPTDVGASTRGCSMGPEAIRIANLGPALQRMGFDVVDAGNVQGPVNPMQLPVDGMRHLDEVVAWNRAVYETSSRVLADGRLPVLLGGDHCLAVGSVSAAAAHCRRTGRRLVVLWLDAHADANIGTSTPTGNMHGMPVACLCGDGPDALTGLSGVRPAIRPDDIRQIGIRSVDPAEKIRLSALGLNVYDMRFIDEYGMRHTMEQALLGVGPDTHLHVSFDVDFIDSTIAPGVGTTVPGGPTYREAQLCMEMIADTGMLASVDVMELNPACDVRNETARLAVDFLESLFGKSTLIRPGR